MSRDIHHPHARDEGVERLEFQHHADLEGLVVQVRALATAIEHLAGAIESHVEDDASTERVRDLVEEARLALRPVW